MNLRDFYQLAGGSYEEVTARLFSEDFVRKILIKYLQDPHVDELVRALRDNALDSAYFHAHTIKGIGLNLGLPSLHIPAAELCSAIRENSDTSSPGEKLINAHKQICEWIISLS